MLHIKPITKSRPVSPPPSAISSMLDRLVQIQAPEPASARFAHCQLSMAARMQVEASEALDVSSETEVTRELTQDWREGYG